MSCEEDKSLQPVNNGHYGMLSLTNIAPCEVYDPKNTERKHVGRLLLDFLSRGSGWALAGSILNISEAFAHKVLIHHQIGRFETDLLGHHSSGESGFWMQNMAIYFMQLGDQYMDFYADLLKNNPAGEDKPPYTLGKSLSDTLELLPQAVSARMLLAASHPGMTRDILKMIRAGSLSHADNQQNAVEAAVLLPREVRAVIFEEMVRLSGKDNGARRFHNLIASEWANFNSPFSAHAAIYRNLTCEEAGAKVQEVLEDLTTLRRVIGS